MSLNSYLIIRNERYAPIISVLSQGFNHLLMEGYGKSVWKGTQEDRQPNPFLSTIQNPTWVNEDSPFLNEFRIEGSSAITSRLPCNM